MFARGWQTWDPARSHESLFLGNDAVHGAWCVTVLRSGMGVGFSHGTQFATFPAFRAHGLQSTIKARFQFSSLTGDGPAL
jgi:hypothetical protein